MAHPARNQSRAFERPDPYCDIDTLLDHVEIAIGQHQVDPDAWMGIEEAEYQRRDMHSAEQGWRGNAHMPLMGACRFSVSRSTACS